MKEFIVQKIPTVNSFMNTYLRRILFNDDLLNKYPYLTLSLHQMITEESKIIMEYDKEIDDFLQQFNFIASVKMNGLEPKFINPIGYTIKREEVKKTFGYKIMVMKEVNKSISTHDNDVVQVYKEELLNTISN